MQQKENNAKPGRNHTTQLPVKGTVTLCPFTGPSSLGLQCTFEDGSICGFMESFTDDFDWIHYSSSTATSGTGPAADHTLGTRSGRLLADDVTLATAEVKRQLMPQDTCSAELFATRQTSQLSVQQVT